MICDPNVLEIRVLLSHLKLTFSAEAENTSDVSSIRGEEHEVLTPHSRDTYLECISATPMRHRLDTLTTQIQARRARCSRSVYGLDSDGGRKASTAEREDLVTRTQCEGPRLL